MIILTRRYKRNTETDAHHQLKIRRCIINELRQEDDPIRLIKFIEYMDLKVQRKEIMKQYHLSGN